MIRAYERVIRSKLPSATLHAGRVADSFHVVFSTPSQAVQTAIEIADALQRHNARHVEMPIPVGRTYLAIAGPYNVLSIVLALMAAASIRGIPPIMWLYVVLAFIYIPLVAWSWRREARA